MIVPRDNLKDNLKGISLIVKIDPDMAHAFYCRQTHDQKLKELLALEKEFNISLKPVHPDVKELILSPYFSTQLSDRATAKKMISRLKNCRGVEAAYFKPRDELAGGNVLLGALP